MQSVAEYHFCTYFDRNYLTRGLALYHSLARHCQRPFNLWVLCFDDETFDILRLLELPNVRLIPHRKFEEGDEELLRAKAQRSRVEYYWTCTPALPLYILQHNPEVQVITYLDADLLFYSDPQPIYYEFANDSILIIEHRYASEYAHFAETAGIYNVGIMAFRRDADGLQCLQWWRDRCLEWCYRRVEDRRFGDQKYLDDWPERFKGVVVLQHKGAGLAPWNLSRYQVKYKRRKITVDDQHLIFYHFHDFKIINCNVVIPSHSVYRISVKQILNIYLPYVVALKKAESQIAFFTTDTEVSFISKARQKFTLRHLEQRSLLLAPRILSILLWFIGNLLADGVIKAKAGFCAYSSGDLRTCRRHLLTALNRNPLLLRHRRVVSILLESFVGSTRMNRYRHLGKLILARVQR